RGTRAGARGPWCAGCPCARETRLTVPPRGSVVCVQHLVERDGALVGLALDGTGLRVAAEQQIRLVGQLPRLDDADLVVVLIQQRDLEARGDVETGFHGAAVAQRNADTGVG